MILGRESVEKILNARLPGQLTWESYFLCRALLMAYSDGSPSSLLTESNSIWMTELNQS